MATKKKTSTKKMSVSDRLCRSMEIYNELRKFKSMKSLAKFLESKGCKGDREDETSCPIATYFRNETGFEPENISVRDEIEIDLSSSYDSDDSPIGGTISLENTSAMDDFIASFDNGEFPELDNDPADNKNY